MCWANKASPIQRPKEMGETGGLERPRQPGAVGEGDSGCSPFQLLVEAAVLGDFKVGFHFPPIEDLGNRGV